MSKQNMDRRIHFLDQLRSYMMLLGLVLHVCASYDTNPPGYIFPFKDLSTHWSFTALAAFIHSFRMQVFFLVAGFFLAMLFTHRGIKDSLKNRAQRVLIPFVVFFIPITGSCYLLFQWGAEQMGIRGTNIEFPDTIALYHLWFLYYLTLYYLASVVALSILKLIPFSTAVSNSFVKRLPVLLILSLGCIQFASGSYMLSPPHSFHIEPYTFLHYGAFFFAGMIAYQQKEVFYQSIESIGKSFGFLLAGIMACVGSVYLTNISGGSLETTNWYGSLSVGLLYTAICWVVLSLFYRWMNKSNRFARYFSEASYWVYLIHLPIAVAMPIAMELWPINVFAKFSISLLMTVLVSTISYHLLVRSTWIGQLLNGKRHPFSLPFHFLGFTAPQPISSRDAKE